ncbi:TIGR04149 family rSAM-modified RiPP [Bacteroides stercorirosoris]
MFSMMKKLTKIKLHEIADAELNEREMCRILGGGTPGCCQCGCYYAGEPGGSSTGANSSANDAHGYVSDGSAQPCCQTTEPYDPGVVPQGSSCGIQKPQENHCLLQFTCS